MSEFDPQQLDRLEDALDVLDDPRSNDELREALGLDEEVAARFETYRHLSAVTREALVDEPAPTNALARAMAAAEAEATGVITPLHAGAEPREPGPADVRGGWQRWWKRWRAGLIPLAALGGTAALVLWIVRPEAAPHLARADREIEQAPARPAPLESEPPAEVVDAERSDRSKPAATSDAEGAEFDATRPQPKARPSATEPSKQRLGGGGKAQTSKEENIASPDGSYAEQPAIDSEDPKGQLYERLEQAHALRRKGNCTSAVVRYERLLGQPDLDALQRARAEAGLGLCREFLGEPGKSGAHYGRAKAQDPTIEGWISSERTKTAPASEKSPRKAKRKKTAAQSSDSL